MVGSSALTYGLREERWVGDSELVNGRESECGRLQHTHRWVLNLRLLPKHLDDWLCVHLLLSARRDTRHHGEKGENKQEGGWWIGRWGSVVSAAPQRVCTFNINVGTKGENALVDTGDILRGQLLGCNLPRVHRPDAHGHLRCDANAQSAAR
jgi:hypothetical protein